MVGERIQKLGDKQAQHGLGHSLKHKVPGMRSHRALPRCDRLSAQLWTPATHAHDMSQLGCEPWAGVADRPADGAVCFRFGVVQRLVCWCLHLSQHMPRQTPNRALPNFALRQAPSSVFGSAPCKQPCALASLPSSRTKMS